VREYRERFRCEIATLESDANFVFMPMANGPDVARRLRERGIAVRAFEGGIRVTIGPWDLMQACIDAIGDL
jgi:histidinol-phosphate/aromatic aminotransferase/cobyric acid decarboxylase-like protein